MRARALPSFLALTLALQSPGLSGWSAVAEEVRTSLDAEHHATVNAQIARLDEKAAVAKLEQAVHQGRLSREDADQAEKVIERYGAATPELDNALTQLGKDLDNQSKDAKLTLNDLFDRMVKPARDIEQSGTYVTVLGQSQGSSYVSVNSSKTGATLFNQMSFDLGGQSQKRIITRPDPEHYNKQVVEAIMVVSTKGSAQEQRVLYNRKVHQLLKNLKKLYFDQCQLVRKINNGVNPPRFKSDACKNPDGSYQIGFYDKDFNETAFQKGQEIYRQKQAEFDGQEQRFCMRGPVVGNADKLSQCHDGNALGHVVTLRQYLEQLDLRQEKGSLDQLDWRDLEKAQRIAMRFYGKNQLDLMQKYVIIQLSSYFSQVTNSNPKSKKDGTETFGVEATTQQELQDTLTSIEQGKLDGYGKIMTFFGVTKLSHEDKKYITPELMGAAGEAFAYVAYAVKAKQRAFDASLSGEETDAAIEESQQWLKLAQISLQTFEMNSLAIQLERLRDGELRDHIGLASDNVKGQAEASRLANLARQQYLPRLNEAARESKDLMLQQSVATFYLTIQNAARAYLFSDTLRDRLRTLAAKAFEMKSLYLAAQFEKVKDQPQYKGRSALENLSGDKRSAFQYFLENRPPEVAALADALDAYAKSLLALTGKEHPDDEIRVALRGKTDEFVRLAVRLGYGKMPDVKTTHEAVQKSAIKQAQFFAALGDLSTKMRIFDMTNELDAYLERYASPNMPDSKKATWWDKVSSFKWMDKAIDWVSGGFAGHSLREGTIETGMKHFPLTKEAFEKLGGAKKEERQKILQLMYEGKYTDFGVCRIDLNDESGAHDKLDGCGAISLITRLDRQSAKRALAEYESDKLEKDPFENQDFDSLMSKSPENKNAIMAQGVVGGLFKQLQTYILGYMGFAAAYDLVFTSLVTAGAGQLLKAFSTAGKATEVTVAAMKAGEMGADAERLTGIARMMEIMSSMTRAIGNYAGRWWTATKGNFISVTGARQVTGFAEHAKQLAFVTFPKALMKNGSTMVMMTMASSGMSMAQHAWAGNDSQFKGYGDAAMQGAIGGAKFGASGGLLMMASPIPRTALGGGKFGKLLNNVALSNGPASAAINFVVRLAPGLEGTAAAGEGGIFGAAAAGAERLALKSPTLGFAAKSLVWGAGMVDGGAKYFLAAEIPKQVGEAGHFLASQILDHFTGQGSGHDGATDYVQNLADANHFGASIAQVSWLMIPMESMRDSSEIRESKETYYGLRQLIRDGRGGEIESATNGSTVQYDRSFMHQLANWEFGELRRGEGKKGELTVSEGLKIQATEMMGKERPLSELAALGTLSAEQMAGKQKVGDLISVMGMEGGKPEAPEVDKAGGLAAKTPKGSEPGEPVLPAAPEAPKSAKAFQASLDRAEAGGPKKLYAYFSESGALQRVSAKNGGKNGIAVAVEVGPDGQLKLQRTAKGNMTAENAAAMKRFSEGVDGVARVEGVLGEVNTYRTLIKAMPVGEAPGAAQSVAQAPEAPKTDAAEKVRTSGPAAGAQATKLQPGEVFVTKEAAQSWKKLLNDRLAENAGLRRQLIESKGQASVELQDPKTGQTFKVAGEPLNKLREAAEWEQLAARPTGAGGVAKALFKGIFMQDIGEMWGRAKGQMLGEKPDTAAQAMVRDLRRSIEKDLDAKAGGSQAENLKTLAEHVKAITDLGGAKTDLEALTKLADLLKRGTGGPDSAAQRAAAELDRMAGGVDPSALVKLRRTLLFDAPPDELVQMAKPFAAKLGDGPAAAELRAILDGPPTKETVDAAQKKISSLAAHAEGAPIETLASFRRSLAGELTADDMILAARQRMDQRVAAAKGVDKAALQDLRGTIESDAYIQLANKHAFDEIAAYRKSGRTEADEAALRDAAALLRETWERGVMGQRFQERVEKDGRLVWGSFPKIREEYQFRDANGKVNGKYIPGFRPGQMNAIEADIVTIAKGKHQIYDLLQTSGGKTLLGFTLIGLLEAAAKERGKDGALYVTANADLVQQALDAYEAFFKGRKPSFEIVDYSELMVRQAQADRTGSLGPFDTHEVFMDEFDQVGMGTPLSLGKFNGKMSFARYHATEKAYRENTPQAWDQLYEAYQTRKWDPMFEKYGELAGQKKLLEQNVSRADFENLMKNDRDFADAYRQAFSVEIDPVLGAMRRGVFEVWFDLYGKYGKDDAGNPRRSMTREEFARLMQANPAFRTEFNNAVAKTTKAVREARETIDPMLSFTPSARANRKAFIDSIPDAYAEARGLTKEQIYVEMLREHRKSLGGALEPGIMTGKYGGLDGVIRKVLEGSFEAASEGPGLEKLYMKDPQRDGIIQFHNDTPLDSLDTFYRTALELREGVSVTNDFENVAITDFAGITSAARKADAITIAASGTLPDNMRPYMAKVGTTVLGKGTDPNKAASIPHEIVVENSAGVQRLNELFQGPNAGPQKLWLGQAGEVLGLGAQPEGAKTSVEVRLDDAGRLVAPRAPENVGLLLDQANAVRLKGAETPYQLAVAREGILRLMRDAQLEPGKKNIAYIWVESLGKMESLLKDLDAHGITMDKTSILTSPVSNFFLQERYMFSIRGEKNVEGLQAGDVEVVVLAGQGGLRGLEAPLGAYGGLPAEAVGQVREALGRGDLAGARKAAEKLGGDPAAEQMRATLSGGGSDVLARAREQAAALKPAGEIKMFVTDSNTLADVSLLQLLGRIDRGRVPENSPTTFTLLDDASAVVASRNYRQYMPPKIMDAANPGGDPANLAAAEKAVGGKIDAAAEKRLFTEKSLSAARDAYIRYLGPEAGKLRQAEVLYRDLMTRRPELNLPALENGKIGPANEKQIFEQADLIDAKSAYRDYMTLRALRTALGPEKLADLMKLPAGPDRGALALEYAKDPAVMKILIVEMRRLAEYQALQSSGILREPEPSRWQRFKDAWRERGAKPQVLPAPNIPKTPAGANAVPAGPGAASAVPVPGEPKLIDQGVDPDKAPKKGEDPNSQSSLGLTWAAA